MMAPRAQPMYFGPPGEGLFGWLHRASEGSASGLALLVCNPFGFEEVCAHRSLRQLAMATAAAGVPTLRFDYAGCGNSEGDEFEPQCWARWIRSIHTAIATLKQASGATRVCLLGVRLGAALATLAALERDDVAGLIAIAPVLRGRNYLRELTILGESSAAASLDTCTGDGVLESAGFVLTRETSDALAQVDLRKLDKAPAPRALVVERDDMPGAAAWLPELQRLGVDVQCANWAGYAAMMDDPQRAQVPHAIIGGVVACLQAWGHAVADAPGEARTVGAASQRVIDPQRGGAPAVVERAVHIDAGTARMFGILTSADADTGPPPAARPAVLMLNSGSVHHIGPNRLWVRLARQWAQRGITVLRIDISGIGDSDVREGAQDNVVYSPHAMQDVAAALVYLRAQAGATECHAMGLCSGAYHALKAAVAGQEIASSLMINPLTFFWKQGMELSDVKDYEVNALTAKYRRKLTTGEPWRKLLRGELDWRVIRQAVRRRLWGFVHPHLLALARALRLPIRNDLARELRQAAEHGIRLRFVFAADAPGFELLQQQSGRAMAPLLAARQASIDFVSGADHTFTRREARERLVALLDEVMHGTTVHR